MKSLLSILVPIVLLSACNSQPVSPIEKSKTVNNVPVNVVLKQEHSDITAYIESAKFYFIRGLYKSAEKELEKLKGKESIVSENRELMSLFHETMDLGFSDLNMHSFLKKFNDSYYTEMNNVKVLKADKSNLLGDAYSVTESIAAIVKPIVSSDRFDSYQNQMNNFFISRGYVSPKNYSSIEWEKLPSGIKAKGTKAIGDSKYTLDDERQFDLVNWNECVLPVLEQIDSSKRNGLLDAISNKNSSCRKDELTGNLIVHTRTDALTGLSIGAIFFEGRVESFWSFTYYSDDWLFIEHVALFYGDNEQQVFSKKSFESDRDVQRGGIREMLTFKVDDKFLKAISKMFDSEIRAVRLIGSKGKDDFVYTKDEIALLNDFLDSVY